MTDRSLATHTERERERESVLRSAWFSWAMFMTKDRRRVPVLVAHWIIESRSNHVNGLQAVLPHGPINYRKAYMISGCISVVTAGKAVAVLGKKIFGAWPLIIWEATTAKRSCYRTN